MTVGKDVSGLFPDVLKNMQTEDIELKKLVYLYLMNYAKTQPELVILAVNTFVKVTSLKVLVLVYLQFSDGHLKGLGRSEPAYSCFSDSYHGLPPRRQDHRLSDPTASKGPEGKDRGKFIDAIRESTNFFSRRMRTHMSAKLQLFVSQSYMKSIPNWQLSKISSARSKRWCRISTLWSSPTQSSHYRIWMKLLRIMIYSLSMDRSSTSYYMLSMNVPSKFSVAGRQVQCLITHINSRWGQIAILTALAEYKPTDHKEAESICDRVLPRLQHANGAVVLAAIKVSFIYKSVYGIKC